MRAGLLRNRIKVYQNQAHRTTTGAVRASWVHVLTLWASVKPVSMLSTQKDRLIANAELSQVFAKCVVRYRTDMDSSMQVEWQGVRWAIDGEPLPDGVSGRKFLTLMLKRVD